MTAKTKYNYLNYNYLFISLENPIALKIKSEKGDIIFPRQETIGPIVLIYFDKEYLVSYVCTIIKNITDLMHLKFALYYLFSP